MAGIEPLQQYLLETGPYKNWNARCAESHATGYVENYDHRTGRYASTQAEIGVGCEACHGLGAAHLQWAACRGLGHYSDGRHSRANIRAQDRPYWC